MGFPFATTGTDVLRISFFPRRCPGVITSGNSLLIKSYSRITVGPNNGTSRPRPPMVRKRRRRHWSASAFRNIVTSVQRNACNETLLRGTALRVKKKKKTITKRKTRRERRRSSPVSTHVDNYCRYDFTGRWSFRRWPRRDDGAEREKKKNKPYAGPGALGVRQKSTDGMVKKKKNVKIMIWLIITECKHNTTRYGNVHGTIQ